MNTQEKRTTIAGTIRSALADTGWNGVPLRSLVEACQASGAIASWRSYGEAHDTVQSAVLRLEARGEVFASRSSGHAARVSSVRLASATPPEVQS